MRESYRGAQPNQGLVDQTVASSYRRLAVVVAGLLLFSLAVPAVSTKLADFWRSEFSLKADIREPLCVPTSYCFRFTTSRVDRVGSTFRLPLRIEGVGNPYELAKELDEGRLKAVVNAGNVAPPAIVPSYHLYRNVEEVTRRIDALLEFNRLPVGPISVMFQHRGEVSPQAIVDIGRTDIGWFGSFLVSAGDPKAVRAAMAFVIALLIAMTCVVESFVANHWPFGHRAFAFLFFLRLIAIMVAGGIRSPAAHTFVVLLILLPWLAILKPIGDNRAAKNRNRAQPRAGTALPPHANYSPARPSLLELGMLGLGLGVFAYMLWFGSSFRWSIFEERDLLEARQLVSSGHLPIYGPELLLGGHTIGSGLYFFLAPLMALWDQPEALHLLNKLLFLGIPLVLWWGLRGWTGPAAALFAVFALIASERMVALSYWPIHPNFSLFFAFLYAASAVRGAAAGRRGWLIFSGLLLGFLLQLHFSYFLLIPCHVLLVLFANEPRGRWTKTLAIAAVFVPIGPFLLIDALQGFPNIAQIILRPRFHSDYPNAPFENTRLLPLLFDWLRQVRGPLSSGIATATLLLIGLGIAVGIGSIATTQGKHRGMTASLAVTILFCIPLIELTLLGMGYNSRHIISLVPAIFMLAGFGFAAVRNLVRPAKEWMAVAAIFPLLVLLGWRAADSSNMTRIVRSEGEWARDYSSRQEIAKHLATTLGLTPQTYAKRTFWWWVGWSIDPAIYAETYRRVVPAGAVKDMLPPDHYVLITAAELPPFLRAVFDSKDSHPAGGMYVHVAKLKSTSALPSSNADTGVRLHPFLQEVDLLRYRQEGFVHIGHQQLGGAQRDLFLATVAEGRIKLLVAIEQSEVQGQRQLRWCVDSPSLNGHYQEIKTLWRPRLVITAEQRAPIEARLAVDVLGSLPYKTPACGEALIERSGGWTMQFAIDGLFDQSFMLRPQLLHRQWPIDLNAPISATSLSQRGIADWLRSRFDR